MADSIVRLKVEDSSFNAQIKEAARTFADFGKRVASAGVDAMGDFAKGVKTAKVAFEGFNAALKANAIVLVASLAVEAASAIGGMISDWITGADDAEDAQARLNRQLEETKRLVESITDEGDFNARIAKASGASTSDVLKIKADAAQQVRNAAMATLLDPKVKVGTKEYDEANKIYKAAEKRYQKAVQDIKVDEVAKANRTGEYAVRTSSGKGGSGGGSGFNTNKIAFNPRNDKVVKPSDYIEVPSVWQEYAKGIKESMAEIDHSLDNLSLDNWSSEAKLAEEAEKANRALQQQKMAFNMSAQAASNFGSALASIEDPAAKAAGTVIQAIANIALGFSAAAAQASSMGPYGWIAYVAAGLATMATAISTVHSLTGYAEGGEIKGNYYSGDQMPIMANAGELVLTKAMQGNLASQLSDQNRGIHIVGVVQGENIVLAARTYGQRTGKNFFIKQG